MLRFSETGAWEGEAGHRGPDPVVSSLILSDRWRVRECRQIRGALIGQLESGFDGATERERPAAHDPGRISIIVAWGVALVRT